MKHFWLYFWHIFGEFFPPRGTVSKHYKQKQSTVVYSDSEAISDIALDTVAYIYQFKDIEVYPLKTMKSSKCMCVKENMVQNLTALC